MSGRFENFVSCDRIHRAWIVQRFLPHDDDVFAGGCGTELAGQARSSAAFHIDPRVQQYFIDLVRSQPVLRDMIDVRARFVVPNDDRINRRNLKTA